MRKLSAGTQHEATTTLTVISSDESTNETPIPSRSDDYCEYELYNINKEYRRLSTIYEVFDEDIWWKNKVKILTHNIPSKIPKATKIFPKAINIFSKSHLKSVRKAKFWNFQKPLFWQKFESGFSDVRKAKFILLWVSLRSWI